MNHNQIVKEQLIHLVFGTLIFIVLASIAVGLDLAAGYMVGLGITEFTHKALEFTAHGMLVLDLVLFLIYLITSSYRLVKGMF